MPPKNPKQQRLMGQALAVKRGEQAGSPAAKKVAAGMSEKQLRDFAKKPKGGYKK